MTKKERKLQTRIERHKINSELKKSNWLYKWLEDLNKEMNPSNELILYVKKKKRKKRTKPTAIK